MSIGINYGPNNTIIAGSGHTLTSGTDSIIAGGRCNTMNANNAVIGGGSGNTANGNYSFVGGGQCNTASGTTSTVGGGQKNLAQGFQSFIGGGNCNAVCNTLSCNAFGSVVVGGVGNNTSGGTFSFASCAFTVAPTILNSGRMSFVGGGKQNTASGCLSFVGGGQCNSVIGADPYNSSIVGGGDNEVSGAYSFIGGGSVFFYLSPKKSVISDVHSELTDFYNEIKNGNSNLIYEFMENHPNEEKTYYQIRDEFKIKSPLDNACRFFYQRKTCFRGMLRYNSKGHFNIPFGRYKTYNF